MCWRSRWWRWLRILRLGVADAEQAVEGHETDEEASPGISYDALLALVRSAAPFAGMSQGVFDGVLDMLAGRYPSDEFAELRPRVTWDRTRNWITPRAGREEDCDFEWRDDSGSRDVWGVSGGDACEAGPRGRAG